MEKAVGKDEKAEPKGGAKWKGGGLLEEKGAIPKGKGTWLYCHPQGHEKLELALIGRIVCFNQ